MKLSKVYLFSNLWYNIVAGDYMFENKKIFILGMARSGYEAAKVLAKRGNTITLNDMSIDQDLDKVKELESKENCLVLCKTSNTKYFKNTLPLGENLEEISKNIFTLLRKVDDYKVDLVVIEGVEPTGLGLAIMNRLIRSCSHNFLELL